MDVEQAIALAYQLSNAGQVKRAEELCREVLTAAPQQAAALHLLGLIAHQRGEVGAAIFHLGEACKAPGAPAVYFSNLAEMLRQAGQAESAERAARQAVARDPALQQGWNNLGIILQETNRLEQSVACLEQALTFGSGNAELLNNLGNSFARLGRLDRAWGHYVQALALKPDYAEAHSNLASALNMLGRYEEALAHARTAIVLNPRLADAHMNAASVLHAQGAHSAAMAQLDSLLQIASRHARGLLLYANCLEASQRHAEALALCRTAAGWHPGNGEILLALGKLLQAQGEVAAADAALQAAAMALPDPAEALAVQAAYLLEAGEMAAANETVRKALQANPRHAMAWATLSELKRFRRNDEDLLAMQKLLGPEGLQGYQEQVHLNFALGKAHLDFGEDRLGFAHFETGNRMKRASIDFDLAKTTAWMRRIALRFSARRIAELAGKGVQDAAPLFVLGMPRSGTTLVEQILASHSQVFGAGELSSVQVQTDALARQCGVNFPELADRLDDDRLRGFGAAHLAGLRQLSGRRFVVDKMPSNFFYAGLIHLALPNARIIHVRRDAADTCLSCYTKLFGGPQQFAYDLAELGGFYREYERLMVHWREVLPASRFIELRYEDVVGDLEAQSRRLLEFCGLDWEPACLRFFETARRVRTASAAQVRQAVYGSSIGRAERYREFLGPLFAALEAPCV
jgi:tetratricopeptide (TPR) repeat protein